MTGAGPGVDDDTAALDDDTTVAGGDATFGDATFGDDTAHGDDTASGDDITPGRDTAPGGDDGPARAATLAEWGLADTAEYIAAVQRADGLIPWYPGGPADPWDHVESAMGLTVAGRHDAAAAAFRWLADAQLDDGSWWAAYDDCDGEIDDGNGGSRRETHRTAYVATGVWHSYRATGDREALEARWPVVSSALAFVVDHQAPTGEVYWTVDADGRVDEDALVTGCSSIYQSLGCGAAIADVLGAADERDRWTAARRRLGGALRSRPDRFDRTWERKDAYAMDWFYPVLCGVYDGQAAAARLDDRLAAFLEPRLGCRCVADEPWVTIAESCELVMALAAVGRREQAARLFGWLDRFRADDGGYWTGYQFADDELWPAQRPTWTAGVALLAADALGGLSPAADLFTGGVPDAAADPDS